MANRDIKTIEEMKRIFGSSQIGNGSKSANHLTEEVIRFLQLSGFVAWRQNNVSVFDKKKNRYRKFIGMRGLPDIIGFYSGTGVWVAIEIKAGNDKPSKEQLAFQKILSDAGGFACIARSLDDVVKEHRKWLWHMEQNDGKPPKN